MSSFATMAEFWAMGGHGLYVWLAYGAALLVLAGNIVLPLLRRRRFVRMYRRREQRQQQERPH